MAVDPVARERRGLLAAGGALGLWPALAGAEVAGAEVSGAAASGAAGSAPPPLLLARDWPPGADPSGWLVSEKFDGVRALWDGRALRLRGGGEVAAPDWFTAALPATPLDGELWAGRGRFDAASAAVRRARPRDGEWRALRYQVFELPGAPGPFTQRLAAIARAVAAAGFDGVQAVVHEPVSSPAALQRRLDAVVRDGGEGLMLHRADAAYVTGRAEVLCKLKPAHDAEAVVLAHRPGRGRHAGRMGALQVRTDDGVTFDLGGGFSDAQRTAPPPVGSRVVFRHQGVTAQGVPRFARFWRLADGG